MGDCRGSLLRRPWRRPSCKFAGGGACACGRELRPCAQSWSHSVHRQASSLKLHSDMASIFFVSL